MVSIPESVARLKGRLVVSCQAWPGDPLDDLDTLRRIACAAVRGGAAGLRIHGAEQIVVIRRDIDLPIIGIDKQYFSGKLRITPDFESAARLARAGASVIALDCTSRTWDQGDPWQEIVERIHKELNLPVMADIATLGEGLAAAAAGADMIGMTLNGYTDETAGVTSFNWPLLNELVQQSRRPVVAEGHISTPAEARRAVDRGAWCVVVGSAITRPGEITERFVRAMATSGATAPAVGVDIGGTSIKAGMVDRQGVITFAVRVPTNASGGRDAIAAAAVEAIGRVLASARNDGIKPVGLGIASAGALDARDGSVFAATENLPGWAGFNLRDFAQQRFQLPTYVYNDAHAAVLAELHFGLGRELADFVALTIGTGVGGGIVVNGHLLRGLHGFAGTFGHQTIRFDGRACNCGRYGCLEAYVSTTALVREYNDQQSSSEKLSEADPAAFAEKISQLASAGDTAAQKAYSAMAAYLAEGVANIFNALDPEAVVLSGGLVEGHAQFAAEVESRVASLLHFGSKRKPRVQLSSLGQFSGLRGAAASVFMAESEDEANL